MMMREDCEKGFFVSFDYTDDAMREADAFFRRSGKSIVLFTVQEILEEHLAKSWHEINDLPHPGPLPTGETRAASLAKAAARLAGRKSP